MSPSPVAPPTDKASASYYSQIRQRVVEVVANASLGDRLPSERALAQQLGTSTLTVGRVLQELQRDGFVQRTPGRGTFVCRTHDPAPAEGDSSAVVDWELSAQDARSSVAKETGAPIVIFARVGLSPDYWRRLEHWPSVALSRIERTLQGLGHRTLVVNLENLSVEDIRHLMKTVREENVSTAIHVMMQNQPSIFPTTEKISDVWRVEAQRWREETDPSVVNLCFSRPTAPGDSISFDGGWGAYLAARHLRELGHKRVAYLAPPESAGFTGERWTNIQQAFLTDPDARVEWVRISLPSPAPSPDAYASPWEIVGRHAAEQFRPHGQFTAVMLANDEMAKGFLEVLGRDATSRLSVVGYDDHLSSSGLGLTTVHVPVEHMAEQTALVAIRRQQKTAGEHWVDLVFKPQLVTRASTRPA